MKRQTQARTLLGLVAAVLVGILALNVWAFIAWSDQASAAIESAERLTECRQMSERILRLRNQPAMAGDSAIAVTEMTPQIESAARRAGIGPRDLVRITPESPRRLGNSPYLEQSTEMVLEGVTLGQSVDLLYAISSGRKGVRVKEIRLTAPPASEPAGTTTGSAIQASVSNGPGTDRWTLEATIAALTYSPADSRPKAPAGDR